MGHLHDEYNLKRRDTPPGPLGAPPGSHEASTFYTKTMAQTPAFEGKDDNCDQAHPAPATSYPRPRQIMWDELVRRGASPARLFPLARET